MQTWVKLGISGHTKLRKTIQTGEQVTGNSTACPGSADDGVYLDSEEGEVVKLFDEASDLLTVFIIVQPRTPLNLHLRDTPEINTPGEHYPAPAVFLDSMPVFEKQKKREHQQQYQRPVLPAAQFAQT